MAGQMSAFQKKADKLLRAHGWRFERYTGNGHAIYRCGDRTTTISSSPRNATDALKAVKKFAGIK